MLGVFFALLGVWSSRALVAQGIVQSADWYEDQRANGASRLTGVNCLLETDTEVTCSVCTYTAFPATPFRLRLCLRLRTTQTFCLEIRCQCVLSCLHTSRRPVCFGISYVCYRSGFGDLILYASRTHPPGLPPTAFNLFYHNYNISL